MDRDIDVLYYGVDHLRFSPNGSKQEAKQNLQLPGNKFIILTTGRLVFKRSVETLIGAAKLLRNDPRVLCVVIGDGPDRINIEEFIYDHNLKNCLLLGSIPHTEIHDYYRAADIFVLPSRGGEGLPISLVEAWASELPVIATRAGGQEEVIRDKVNGLLVDPCAPQQIAQTIHSFLDQ